MIPLYEEICVVYDLVVGLIILKKKIKQEHLMEGLAVIGFVFGIMGLVAFVRLEKL